METKTELKDKMLIFLQQFKRSYVLLYFTIETRWKIITVFSVREKK